VNRLKLKTTKLLHGADYNYEQWMDWPKVHDDDFVYMQRARCNVASVGIFSWSMLEPEEGEFRFEWMDGLMDRLHENGMYAILATPSGSKPAWMSRRYPEVCQVDRAGRRQPHGQRHNHCRTSPIYREKCITINRKLAERYGRHPALLMWHVSNEYNATDCYCEHCLDAFRAWLRDRYRSLEELNHAWWTTFWSHRFTSWEQIEPYDTSIHGLQLDWRRFISDQTIDFFRAESGVLREITPAIPITTNFMKPDVGLNYWRFAEDVDIVAWDAYPRWHYEVDEWREGMLFGFYHDLHRSYKGAPFLLMESTPSATDWQGISVPKKPNMHLLSSLQAVAHGSNSVQYFQWRAGRGGTEKFHGAVINHLGTDRTNVFRDVTAVGESLEKLEQVCDGQTDARVAITYDLENEWALRLAQTAGSDLTLYQETCVAHYEPFWRMGVTCDVIDSHASQLSGYRLVVAPMLYMIRPGVEEKMTRFVEDGGTLVLTYFSGIVNETDLCFLGGFPGPLRDIAGVTVSDTDIVHGLHTQSVSMSGIGNLTADYRVLHFADRMTLTGAEAIGYFREGSLAGEPAITMHRHGKGFVYYVGARTDEEFLIDLYTHLVGEMGIERNLAVELPTGVTCQKRTAGDDEYLFVMNFNRDRTSVPTGGKLYYDLISGESLGGVVELESYGIRVLKPKR